MHFHVPRSETENNIAAIKRAIDHKATEVDLARRRLTDLQAELRGLQAALHAISPNSEVKQDNGGGE
jgi:hypothetical protein